METVKTLFQVSASLLSALTLLFAADSLIFRSGWYERYLEPDSNAGATQLTLLRARHQQAQWSEPLILSMGDSRMNYSPKAANEYAASIGWPYRMSHGGVAGTTLRAWYYILREIDPTARRYKAIVLPVDDFDDEDTYNNFNDYPLDAAYLALLLRVTDLPDYPLSYTTPKYAYDAWRACLLKGLILRRDIQALLNNPRKRAANAKAVRDWWPNGSYDYLEDERNVSGLSIDWTTRAVTFPSYADEHFRETVKTVLLRPAAPQTGRYADYRRRWFGKIFERYRGTGTRILIVKLPRAPIIRPPELVSKLSSSIRDFAKVPHVRLGDEHRYEPLERPENFKDALHLNRQGSLQYTRMLVDELRVLMGNSPRAL
jgi:hypothetical protein